MMTTILADTAAAAGPLEAIQKTFGLSAPFFFAQVINFFLVIFVLKKFAFGPIQQMLEERRSRIPRKIKVHKGGLTPTDPDTVLL